MIIVPELETVVILVPRTGSGSLYRSLLEKYPKAMMPYRHMEACGVPQGYDRYHKVGVVRHPLLRLWSLYKFLHRMPGTHEADWTERQRQAVQRPFDDWILNNEIVFTSSFGDPRNTRFYPRHTVRYALPENRKSQFVYLRPDLGTVVWPFEDLSVLSQRRFGVQLGNENATEHQDMPRISAEAHSYMLRVFAWDYEQIRQRREAAYAA